LNTGNDVEALRKEMDARDEEWQNKLKQKENELEELRRSTTGEIKKLKEKQAEMEKELEKARATEQKLRYLSICLYLKLTPNTHFISALTHCGECVCFTVH
jgi:predicted nuclease with TOPRIM domain